MSRSGGNTSKRLDYLATRKLSTDSFAMLVPLTQLLRVIKVYFPLALFGPKGINVEFTAHTWQVVDSSISKSSTANNLTFSNNLKCFNSLYHSRCSNDSTN